MGRNSSCVSNCGREMFILEERSYVGKLWVNIPIWVEGNVGGNFYVGWRDCGKKICGTKLLCG